MYLPLYRKSQLLEKANSFLENAEVAPSSETMANPAVLEQEAWLRG